MKGLKFPVFRENGSKMSLNDVLNIIFDNELVWSVMDFYGSGAAPEGMTMKEFEEKTRSSDCGFFMSWPDLKKFSASLFDVNNCLIAGALKPENVSFEKIVGGDFSSIEVLVLLLNGTEWCVYARDAALESQFGRYGEA